MFFRSLPLLCVFVACIIWGLSPLYYKLLIDVPALEVMGHRTLWSFVFFAGFLAMQGRLSQVKTAMTTPGQAGLIAISTIMVATNWLMFIHLVQVGRTTDTSLGYFVSPLVSVVLGWAVLGESLSGGKIAAVALASVGVFTLGFGLGAPPLASLFLAVSFAIYGLCKRRLQADAMVTVTAEVCILGPLAMVALLWWGGAGQITQDLGTALLLIGSGPLTAVPLVLFTIGAKGVPLATLGMAQYLNPSLQFLLAVAIFSEQFTLWHTSAFAIIWTALAIYSVAGIVEDRARRKVSIAASGSGTDVT